MTILWILAVMLVLFFAFHFSRGLEDPWPTVIAVICVVLCLLMAIGLIYPGLLNTPIHR